MKTSKTPQHMLLLSHFKKVGNISALEAGALYRVRSLSRRVNDLEARGCVFIRQMKTDATGQRYVRYHYDGMKH